MIESHTRRSIVAEAKAMAKRRSEVTTLLRAALERGAAYENFVSLAQRLVALKDEPLPAAIPCEGSVDEESADGAQKDLNKHNEHDIGAHFWSQLEAQAGPERTRAFARSVFGFAREVSRKRDERLEKLRTALAHGDRDAVVRHSRYLVGLSEEQ